MVTGDPVSMAAIRRLLVQADSGHGQSPQMSAASVVDTPSATLTTHLPPPVGVQTTLTRFKITSGFQTRAPFALLSARLSAGIRDVTRHDKTFVAPLDSDFARWNWS